MYPNFVPCPLCHGTGKVDGTTVQSIFSKIAKSPISLPPLLDQFVAPCPICGGTRTIPEEKAKILTEDTILKITEDTLKMLFPMQHGASKPDKETIREVPGSLPTLPISSPFEGIAFIPCPICHESGRFDQAVVKRILSQIPDFPLPPAFSPEHFSFQCPMCRGARRIRQGEYPQLTGDTLLKIMVDMFKMAIPIRYGTSEGTSQT